MKEHNALIVNLEQQNLVVELLATMSVVVLAISVQMESLQMKVALLVLTVQQELYLMIIELLVLIILIYINIQIQN
jgi:hypothetical protein